MKAHTSAFKENVKLFGRELDSIITYDDNGETVVLGNEALNSVSPIFESAILKSAMKELKIDSNVVIPVGTVINYQFGVKTRYDVVEDFRDNYDYIDFGNYIVKEVEKQEDVDSYNIICYDKMLYSMVDYESMNIIYPITVRNYINSVCTHLGLEFANLNDTFANYDKQIATELYLDSEGDSLGYTFRDVLDELAQVTASTICINDDDELEIRYINDTGDTIDAEYLKDVNVKFGEMYGAVNTIVLSRSGADKIYKSYPDDLPENQRKAIEIADNQIMNGNDRDTYLTDILNRLNGLQYYLNDFSSTGITYYDMCDRYNIQIGEDVYSCIMFNDEINITQGLEENVYTDLPEESETDYTKSDKTDRRINQTYFIVDKQNQVIESVVTNVTEQDNKISQITQTVDELNSKIQDIADITTSGESNYATFDLDNVNESEPIQIKVKPITENISHLFPSNTLYPNNNLKLRERAIRFYNNTTQQSIEYELPSDLLYYDSTHYDEFYLDYDSHTCQVTKRCKYNSDGTVGLLPSEQTISYPYPYIPLDDGDYTITILGYQYGYLFVRLMAKNIYTTQFYTKAETDSHINQKADEIELGVSQTLTNYSTTSEMNSAINVKANEINSVVSTKVGNNEIISKINQTAENITINASKVNIDGVLTAINDNTTTTINGDKITTGTITASQVDSSVITTNNLSAQNINGNQISGGTITGTTISGNAITGGTISGATISGSAIRAGDIKIGSRETTIATNGDVSIYPDAGGVFRFAQGGVRLNATYGVAISSNGGTNIYASDNNVDIKSCYDATTYIGCMSGNGTGERSAIGIRYDQLYLKSNYGSIYANGVAIGGSSSINTKENIKDLTEDKKQELYLMLKNIPLKEYDYKEQYGKKENYGFLIEDIENTKLNNLLHIVRNEVNPDIKVYSSEDLTRLELIVIQELMKKIETLEEKIEKLERESDK